MRELRQSVNLRKLGFFGGCLLVVVAMDAVTAGLMGVEREEG